MADISRDTLYGNTQLNLLKTFFDILKKAHLNLLNALVSPTNSRFGQKIVLKTAIHRN